MRAPRPNPHDSCRQAGNLGVILLGITTLATALQPALAEEKPPVIARMEVGVPAGFEDLSGPQQALVDVYFGDRKLGQTMIVHRPGSVRFEEPDRLIALLPELAEPAIIRASLAAEDLPSNAHKVCMPGANPAECGRLMPEVAGVIFDEQHFRVDVFVNPRLLKIEEATQIAYLPKPQAGVAVVNALSAVMSGSSSGERNYNLQNRLIVGDADKRLRADLAYSSAFGVQADQLVAELDRPGWRFSGGAFWAPGSSLVGRRKILGIGAETQFDTRLDKDEMRGNPLVVFLGQRAKVDILRDGRVIASRIYDGGNQSLDTSGLPDGAYEVVLRIEEASGAVRKERRFFTRNRQIAPMGQRLFHAYVGLMIDDQSRKFLAPTSTPFAQVGAGWRLSPRIALDATVLATDKTVLGEAGVTWISPEVQFRLGGIVSSNGARGGQFHVSSSGNSRFNFDFDLRHIQPGKAALPGRQAASLDLFANHDLAALPIARSTYTQLAGSLNYSLSGGQIGVAGNWRRERGTATTYNAGPWIRWNLIRKGPWNLLFSGDYSTSSQGNAGYAGLTLRFQGSRTAIGSDAGFRTRRPSGEAPSTEAARSGPVGSLNASWNRDQPGGTDIELAAGYDRDLDQQLINGRALLRTTNAQFSGDVVHSLGDAGGTQYSLGLQTTLAARGGNLALVGKNPNDSMIMVGVDGGPAQSRFEVLVDEMPMGTVRSGGKLALAVTPYRQYKVRIRPTGADLLHYDGTARRIGLYPGNVAHLEWPVSRLVALFGQLEFTDGRPVAGANIRSEGGIGQTDDRGYFQIETAEGAELVVALADGRSCRVQPSAANPGDAFVKLGTVVCNPSFPGSHFTTALLP